MGGCCPGPRSRAPEEDGKWWNPCILKAKTTGDTQVGWMWGVKDRSKAESRHLSLGTGRTEMPFTGLGKWWRRCWVCPWHQYCFRMWQEYSDLQVET